MKHRSDRLPADLAQHAPAGAEVFHLFGSPYVLVLPTTTDEPLRCAVCNESNGQGDRRCRICRRALIQ